MSSDDRLSSALEEIRGREQRATPGPWAWFGNTDTQSIYLATKRWGRFTVMSFRRWGMHGARPMFAVNRTWKPQPESDADFGTGGRMVPADGMFASAGQMADADTLAVYEVAPAATGRKDPRVYRADLSGIRNPDAEFIAHAREDVPRLLAALDAVLKEHQPSTDPDYPQEDPMCPTCGEWYPCDTVRAITRELTGEGKSDGG